MSIEIRDLETRYFDVERATLIRVERVRGEFDLYDGSFETLKVSWWLESSQDRRSVTHSEIGSLISGNEIEPVGLANYFADVNDLGRVISRNFTSLIDFNKTFGRDNREMFPRLDRGIL